MFTTNTSRTMWNLCIVFFILCGHLADSVSANVLETQFSFLTYKKGQSLFYASGKNIKLKLIDLEKKDESEVRFDADTDVNFMLFTRSNPIYSTIIKLEDAGSLKYYKKGKATKIISHGWNNDGNSEINLIIRDAFLRVLDVNIIVVDWGKGANGSYTFAIENVPKVGSILGKLVNWLIDQGSPIRNFHIMGHSLGAHIAGIGARSVTQGKIPYVTGFDPASPLWGNGSQRIRPSDAGYVEIIHTNAGNAGLSDPVGHSDFYPNGGTNQPGCSITDVGCAHGRSYLYFADSLDHTQFQSNLCKDHREAMNKNCSNLGKIHMGGSKAKSARGAYYLTTNANKPFYQN